MVKRRLLNEEREQNSENRLAASATSELGTISFSFEQGNSRHQSPLYLSAAGPWLEEKVALETRDLIGSIFSLI